MDEKQFKLEKDIDRSTISRWRELTCGLSSSCRVLLGTTCRWKLSKLLEPCQDSACSCSRDRTRRCCTEGACCPAAAVASARSWTASWRRCGRCNGAMDSSTNRFWRQRRWMQSCTAKCRNRQKTLISASIWYPWPCARLDAVSVSARTEQSTIHHFFSACACLWRNFTVCRRQGGLKCCSAPVPI